MLTWDSTEGSWNQLGFLFILPLTQQSEIEIQFLEEF